MIYRDVCSLIANIAISRCRYICPSAGCTYWTVRPADLQRHLKSKHARVSLNPETSRTFDCPYVNEGCGSEGIHGFKRKDHLKDHCRSVHHRSLLVSSGAWRQAVHNQMNNLHRESTTQGSQSQGLSTFEGRDDLERDPRQRDLSGETAGPSKIFEFKQYIHLKAAALAGLESERKRSERLVDESRNNLDPQAILLPESALTRESAANLSQPIQVASSPCYIKDDPENMTRSAIDSAWATPLGRNVLPVRVCPNRPRLYPDGPCQVIDQVKYPQNENRRTILDAEEIDAPSGGVSFRQSGSPSSQIEAESTTKKPRTPVAPVPQNSLDCSTKHCIEEGRSQSDASETSSNASQLSNLSGGRSLDEIRMKHTVIASLMRDVYAIFDPNWDAKTQSCPESGAQTTTSSSPRAFSSSSRAQKTQKRQSRDDRSLPEDDRNGKRARKSISATELSERQRLLACPFHKYDPLRYKSGVFLGTRYRTCMTTGQKSIAHLK